MQKHEIDALIANLPSKSAKIRALAEAGMEKADIARHLGISYQFAYNVLATPAPARTYQTERPAPANAEPTAANGALTIDQAKRGLAAHFGVSPDAIEITIRG